jgi:hypothetical protein
LLVEPNKLDVNYILGVALGYSDDLLFLCTLHMIKIPQNLRILWCLINRYIK